LTCSRPAAKLTCSEGHRSSYVAVVFTSAAELSPENRASSKPPGASIQLSEFYAESFTT